MLKGTQKQMVVLRTNGSAYYEEAYFVLREGRVREGEAERTMLEEANRILDESGLLPAPRRFRRLAHRVCFAVGVMTGALLCGAFWLLVTLLT